MRRRAISRPVGSYHSFRVWMFPPVPPVPMAMAGKPLEIGMLASVEPRRDSVRRLRWRSTARRVWRMVESVGRAPGGAASYGFDLEFSWSIRGVLAGKHGY